MGNVPIFHSARSVTFPAFPADSIELEAAAIDHGAELLGDPIIEGIRLGAGELDDPRAALADEVIVPALLTLGGLVARLSVVEVPLDGEAAFLEQAQRAVHRGVADPRVDLLHLGVELLDADVAVGGKKHAGDVVALRGGLEASLLEPLAKRF